MAMAPADAQMGVTPIERIEVTGTNIRRVDSETPSEVQVITADQMIWSGYTSVSQVLRDLTANGQGTLTQGFNRAFAGGASGVALRGLTVGATLILIDGYRMAGYPLTDDAQRSFVDISSIPFVAVDRIEVLLDGASAIYGSDAIAGVINVILRKSFKGTNVMVTGGSTQYGGGQTLDAQITQGFGDVAAGLGGYVAFEYRHQNQIMLDQRLGAHSSSWNITDFTSWGGQNLNPGARSQSASNPAVRGAPYLQNPTGPASNPATFAFLNSNCDLARRNANQCQYTNDWGQIQPSQQNVNLLGSLTIRLPSDWGLNLQGSYFDSQSEQHNNPALIPFGSFPGIIAFGPNQIPAILNPVPNFTVPASYPGNPFGVAANVRAITPDITGRTTRFDSGTSRLVAQLSGAAYAWEIVGAAGYTNVRSLVTYSGYVNPTALRAALNDPVNPYLLTGGNSAQLQDVVTPTVTNTVANQLSFIQASGSRDLMQLEGGPLIIAVGVGDVSGIECAESRPATERYGQSSVCLRGRQPEQRQRLCGVDGSSKRRSRWRSTPRCATTTTTCRLTAPGTPRSASSGRRCSNLRCAGPRKPGSGRRSSPRPATAASRFSSTRSGIPLCAPSAMPTGRPISHRRRMSQRLAPSILSISISEDIDLFGN